MKAFCKKEMLAGLASQGCILGKAPIMPPKDSLPCPSGVLAQLGSWEHGSTHPSLSPEGASLLSTHYIGPKSCSGNLLELALASLGFSIIHFSALMTQFLPAPLG